jgi:predicted esterase
MNFEMEYNEGNFFLHTRHICIRTIRLIVSIVFLLFISPGIFSQELTKQKIPRQPYFKYILNTSKSDTITFYLSEFISSQRMPLIVYIQGSGNGSLFVKSETGQILPKSGHITWANLAMTKARILIIEKPGVQYLQQDQNNLNFDTRFSLDSWTERIEEIIHTVLKTEKIDSTQILIAGHSEGGIAAAKLINNLGSLISHTAILAGEGPSQLYSLYKLAEKGIFFAKENSTIEKRVDSLLQVWEKILKQPTSIENKFWGFTYLRWSSFLKTSVIEELRAFKGKILILQGDLDENVHPESAKILYTSLLSKGCTVELEMIEGADHSFNITANPAVNGWERVIQRSINWFLNLKKKS